MDPILALAEKYNLTVIEDACQAHGAEYFSQKQNRWCKAGSMGHAAAFSFYPGKNLGACGEAGAVSTNDERSAGTIRMLRDHGQVKKYYHDLEGYNGRLDAIQAGILTVKLKQLPTWNTLRREAARRYHDLFNGKALSAERVALSAEPVTPCDERQATAPCAMHHAPCASFLPHAADCQLPTANSIVPPYEPSWSRAVYHLYVIRVHEREKLQAYLAEHGIATALHYPVPLHMQKAYEQRRFMAGDLAAAEGSAREILSLPMFPGLTGEQQERVTSSLKAFYADSRPVEPVAQLTA
jgi:dTDP-4-amino-4,6-dideoxygalactose transaminase